MCHCTASECVLLEIWLCRLCNKRTSSFIMPLPSVEGHPPWNYAPIQQKCQLWFQRRQHTNWGSYSIQNTLYLEYFPMQNCSPTFATLVHILYTQTSFFSLNQLGISSTRNKQPVTCSIHKDSWVLLTLDRRYSWRDQCPSRAVDWG